MPARPVHLLCPLAVEARVLRKGFRSVPEPIVVGPRVRGAERSGPAAWIAAHATELRSSNAIIVLAGVAGALRTAPHAGEAVVVDEVIDTHGRMWPCSVTAPSRLPRAVALSVDEVVTDTAGKRRLAARHPRAVIVDLESASFAAAAELHGLRWLVVRGISDGIDDELPAGVGTWTATDGSTRLGAVVAALARRPALTRSVLRLGRRTEAAMRAVGAVLAAILPTMR